MLQDYQSRFWFGATILFGVIFGAMLFASTTSLRVENTAKAAICQSMANEVLAGTAARVDYMATRCPAALLIPEQDA